MLKYFTSHIYSIYSSPITRSNATAAPWMFLQVSAFAGGPQTLRLWDFVLLSKTALSERSEFAVFESAFSKISEP